MTSTREAVYYWKCDRPAALHGVGRASEHSGAAIIAGLRGVLGEAFPGVVALEPAGGKGNHRTFLLRHEGSTYFVRVEDGPEGDGHLDVESRVLTEVAKTGVPVPRVFFTDATRRKVPFAVQVIEFFECADLNQAHAAGRLEMTGVAAQIGRAVARWQAVPVEGFGPFSVKAMQTENRLRGYHATYPAYFRLNLERHLGRLTADGFLTEAEAGRVRAVVAANEARLRLAAGCLVHKDLALWNILGTAEDGPRAYIDWDDAIAGDPTDDLSLIACFHPAEVVAAVGGYAEVRPLPEGFAPRFWLHLLRNLVVKAVIRGGAGYFAPGAAGFLHAPGQDGPALKAFTRERLFTAVRALENNRPPEAVHF